jgi:hypothetical protein
MTRRHRRRVNVESFDAPRPFHILISSPLQKRKKRIPKKEENNSRIKHLKKLLQEKKEANWCKKIFD